MAGKKYRILSLDGGGVRGIIATTILKHIYKNYPEFFASVDLIAGTSTGGIISLGLAAGLSPTQVAEFYLHHSREVFDDSIWDNVRDGGKAIGAQYDNANLKTVIEATLAKAGLAGDKIKDLKKHVLIASFDLNNASQKEKIPAHSPIPPAYQLHSWKPKFFNNFNSKLATGLENPDLEEKIVDVAMRTSAAPTFFPAYEHYIDGGVIANNPSMCALAQSLDKRAASQEIEDIVLLSIGTGREPQFIDHENLDWGWVQWMIARGKHWLLEIMLDGSVGLADYQCRQILRESYHRYNPILPFPIGLDEWQRIDELQNIVPSNPDLLSDLFKWMDCHWFGEG